MKRFFFFFYQRGCGKCGEHENRFGNFQSDSAGKNHSCNKRNFRIELPFIAHQSKFNHDCNQHRQQNCQNSRPPSKIENCKPVEFPCRFCSECSKIKYDEKLCRYANQGFSVNADILAGSFKIRRSERFKHSQALLRIVYGFNEKTQPGNDCHKHQNSRKCLQNQPYQVV